MSHPFLRKLRHGACLAQENEEFLMGLARPTRSLGARENVAIEGEVRRHLTLILEGWASLYSTLENGKRQIISLLLPGDLCEPFGILPRFNDQAIIALTPLTVAQIRSETVRNTIHSSPRIEEALWWNMLMAAAIEREHLISLGRRTATERLGHLFCELHLRLEMIGRVNQDLSYDMPVTQADLGDLLGLSLVHVNRSLQELRATGVMSLRGRRLKILDLQGLREISLFDESYLHRVCSHAVRDRRHAAELSGSG